MLEACLEAAKHLFSPGPLLGMLAMLPIALVSGLMPGGNLQVAIIALGFAGYIDPWITMSAVIFFLAATDITEPIPSILLGIPGSSSSQATVLDGYPMSQQGLAGVAIGASYVSGLIGGLIGAAALLLVLPVSREMLRLFGSSEFFLFSLLGIVAVAVVSAGAFVKGMVAASFGLAIAMIGFSPITGVVRANFGIDYLWDGMPLAPIVVGLFAIPELIALVVSDKAIARDRLDALLGESSKDVYRGMRVALQHKWLIVRSALIGTFVGIMPGLGGSAAHWIAYAQARQTEKGAAETFGKGDVRGVIAADSANNSVDGGVLIPTVVFGIPGSGGMAIILAILIIAGIQPGPGMLTQHMDLTVSLVYTIALANIIVVPIMLVAAVQICKIAAVPSSVLAPIVIGFVTLAAYQATYSIGDLFLVLAFAVLGVFMKRYGWPRPPILIAVVLSGIVEKYLWLSTQTYGVSMFSRPQILIITALMAVAIFLSLRIRAGASAASAKPYTGAPAS